METLFRLVLARPPREQDDEAPSISLSQATEFQAALGQAQGQADPRAAVKALARQFVASPGFVGEPSALPAVGRHREFDLALRKLEQNEAVSNDDVADAIESAFGETPAELVASDAFNATVASLRDSLIAIKHLPEQHPKPIEQLTNMLRDFELVAAVHGDAGFPGTGAALRRYRRRSVRLPSAADFKSSLSTFEQQKELEKKRREREGKRRKKAEKQYETYETLKAAIAELTRLGGSQLLSTPQSPSSGFLLPARNRPVQTFIEEMSQKQQLSQLRLLRSQALFASAGKTLATEAATVEAPEEVGTGVETAVSAVARQFLTGSPSFTPVGLSAIGFRVSTTARRGLSEETSRLLQQRGLSLDELPLDEVVRQLTDELEALSRELDETLGRPEKHSFKRMGNAMVRISTPMPSMWSNVVVGIGSISDALTFPDTRIPNSHGSVSPAGVADLLVIKQQLVRYEGADVAHIENILKGERKEREHTRRRETEELIFRESEITTSEERELESTSRFEMSRESSETIKEDSSLKAGLSVSGKYGPVVEFSASAEGSISRSKTEALKSAAKFSQDVTERSATKVTERLLERSSLRVTNEVIDKNGHLIDNTGGDGHIAGVYQWVHKVYQAQMYNYGIRTLFDFMVPEPAAFLIEAMQEAHANAVEIVKPMPFTLRPNQISEFNYHTWVREYGATDVQPPPEIYITKSLDFKAGGGDDKTDYNHSGQLQIDEGYRAVHGTVAYVGNIWDDSYSVDVVLGSRAHRFNRDTGWVWSTSLDNERDSIPFIADSFQVSQVAVGVEVKCQRTDRAMMKWRLDTHAKLTNAYKARLAEYEEKLAALELQAGVEIEGKNPALNLELMKDELKKNCISILTEQHYDAFDAIATGSNGMPQIDLYQNEAEGPYVRFFEQAFEWEHLTWVTYPYFWGRKHQWDERIAYEDTDPLFNQFLKAGYCRVTVPARPGFEGAIDHFMSFGEIWNGGPLPPISSELYLPIADELAERLDRPGDEFPEGEPWLVRVPTTLVHLRADDKLPRWEQNEEGEWVEDDGED